MKPADLLQLLREFYREKSAMRARHVAAARLMPEQHFELFPVEFLEQRQQIGQEPCFSLHAMQTRVHGIAFRRASAIGSPQSRQMP